MQYRASIAWMPRWGINYAVGLDGVSLVMVLLTTLLGPITVLGSYRYITRREKAFYALLLAMITAMLATAIPTRRDGLMSSQVAATAIAQLSATAAWIAPSNRSHGMSTKPADSEPTIAPTVFHA